jgi:uncharacterized membrane protein
VSAEREGRPATGPQEGASGAGATRDAAFAIEALVARILVIGTYLAVALILVGVAGMLASGVDPLSHGERPGFDAARIPGDIVALRPLGFLWAGLALVMALPVGRVIVSGLGFLAARDRRLAMVSLLVLLVVGTSIVAALVLGA